MNKNATLPLIKLTDGILKVDKLNFNKPLEPQIRPNEQPWLDKILYDLIQENNSSNSKGGENNEGELLLGIHIEKKHSTRLDDYILIKGKIEVAYPAECVRCLIPTSQSISCEFSSCFIKSSFEKSPEYKDSTEIYIHSEDRDLHFYKGHEIDVKGVILEEIYVNKNHFPLHDPDCKGLCSTCGENLNESDCGHKQDA